MPQPVAVTGLGAVTPYGTGVAPLWAGLVAGKQTAGPVTRFDASRHPVRIACEVPASFDAEAILPRKLLRQLDPFGQYAVVAADEALRDAGLVAGDDPALTGADPDRVGTLIASGVGGIDELTAQHRRLLDGGPGRVRPYLSIAMPVNMAGGQVAIRHGLRGPTFSVVSACASAADALGVALDLLRAGRADVVVAGGAEAAINPLTLAGFAAAGALSRRNDEPERASRPFDLARDGFVTGEGAAAVVLERAGHAAARGARVHAWLAGWGGTDDAFHPTRPAPGGEGAVRALRAALADAGLVPGDVDHVNAHGTSTPLNDAAEAAALRAVLGGHTDAVAVTATKSAIGHLLGAAGAVEAVATVCALESGLVPATLNLDDQDPACDLAVVRGGPRAGRCRAALSNSFGFGGHNTVLAFTSA